MDGIRVTVTCRVLGLCRARYYRWVAVPITATELQEAYRAHALFQAHQDDPEFGYRLLADEASDAGVGMSRRTAWRICHENRWWSVFGKKRAANGKKPGPPVPDDLVQRRFCAEHPDQVWLTDIPPQAGGAPTEHRTDAGKFYLCAIKDVCSGRIVGYSIDSRMKARLAVNALVNAVARRGDAAGCIVHSDRGSRFRFRKFVRALAAHDLVGSMGQVGVAGDNAAMESFFALLQKNVLDRQHWHTRQQLRVAIVTWIERTYHRRRRQDRLGGRTPIEFEIINTTQTATAA